MKLNIINIGMTFIISMTTTGCITIGEPSPAVNSYAFEKSLPFKNANITSKVLNETNPLYMSFPFSMQVLLLNNEAITPLIPLSEEGVMSIEYYLNIYKEEQNLIYAMFERRKTFTKLQPKYVDKINSSFDNKNFDFVMYFGTSTLGELDIYLKDTKTNRTFLVWKDGITNIDPIQTVEDILKAKILYTTPIKVKNVKVRTADKTLNNVDFINVKKEMPTVTQSIKNIDHISTLQKQNLKPKPIKVKTLDDETKKTLTFKDKPKKNHCIVKSIENKTVHTKPTQSNTTKISIKKEHKENKTVKKINYYNSKRDSAGCYAYNALNQCIVW
jgi:hypothetical protein